jgi:hypothetical protein
MAVPQSRARVRAGVSIALLVLSGIAMFVGIGFLYLRQEVLSPQAFAGRAADSLTTPAVRDYVAQRLTEDVVENADPRTLAARPIIETTIAGVVGNTAFRPLAEGAAAQLYGALATRTGGRATLGLTDGVVLALEALQQQGVVPFKLPKSVKQAAIDLGETRSTGRVIRYADQLRLLGVILPSLAVVLMLAAVLIAPRRRRAVAQAGAALAIAGGLLAIALPVTQYFALRGVPGGLTRDAANGLWDAEVGDLQTWALAGCAVGLVVWLTAAGLLLQVPLPTLIKRGWTWAMRPPTPGPWTYARGAGLVILAILLAFAWETTLHLAVLAVSLAVAVQGLTLLLSRLAPAPAQTALDGPLQVPHPRRRSVIAAVAAVTIAVMAGGIALGTRGPATYGTENVTACNGYAELCGRNVNDVAFAATHNSMSAADQPDWFRAEHRFGIPAQLRAGIRGFLIDVWYGVASGGHVSSDFARSPDDSARVEAFRELTPEQRRSFLRLRGNLGFPSGGRARPFLCHIYCEAGATDLVKGLTWFRQFLDRNPGEVIILDIEDYVAPNDLRLAFAESGLLQYVYRYPVEQAWPTLGQLIESNQRVIVMTEHHNGGIPWILPAYHGYLQETPYKFKSVAAVEDVPANCRPFRGGVDKPFFLLNNWVENALPNPSDAGKVNNYDTLLQRAKTCEQLRGHIPNLVAVDFYTQGDVLGVVNALNGLPATARPEKN